MRSLGENGFHVLMASLVVLSTLLDPALRGVLPSWRPPEVGFVTFTLAVVWLVVFVGYRTRVIDERLRVLEDRAERAQQKLAALEDAERQRQVRR